MGLDNGFIHQNRKAQMGCPAPTEGPMDYYFTIEANGVPLIHPKLQGQLGAYGNRKGVPTPTIWSPT